MSKFRVPIALLMMLWLPLQGVAAVAMPFCMESARPGVDAATSNPHLDHQHVAGVHSEDVNASKVPGTSHTPRHGEHSPHLQCNDCGVCHLACAPMVGVAVQTQVVPDSETFSSSPQAFPPAHLLDPPHPPPLA
jgi:hypothetical protein